MNSDIFGNLRDWGLIPEQIAKLVQSGALDDHQEGLIRILRYQHNWKLRIIALESISHLRSPTNATLSEVLNILVNEGLYEVRVIAASVLDDWFRSNRVSDTESLAMARRIEEQLCHILKSPQPPVLHEAVRNALAAVQDAMPMESA